MIILKTKRTDSSGSTIGIFTIKISWKETSNILIGSRNPYACTGIGASSWPTSRY